MLISRSNAYNTIQEIKNNLEGNNIATCVIRAHALGYLSHPTGIDQGVYVIWQ